MGTNNNETTGTFNTILKVSGTVPIDMINTILRKHQRHESASRYRQVPVSVVPVKPAEPSGHIRLPVLAGEVG